MAKKIKDTNLQNLPVCAVEFIKLIIKKMGYRKKVRADVQSELTAHFEDELKNCATDKEKAKRAEQLITDFGDVKLLAVLLRRAKKRCRPLWRTVVARGFQAIGVFLLCFIVYCIYICLGKPNISVNYIEEVTRMARPVVDETQNAAPLYQKAIDAYKEPPVVDDETGTEKSLLDAILGKNRVKELNEEELVLMKQWIGDNTDAINLFKQASQKPYCWWHREAEDDIVLNILMPELRSIKEFAKLLCWQAKLQAFNGEHEQAFDNLLACYRVGRHYKGPHGLIEQLIGMAVQGLSAGTATIILSNQQIESELLKNFQTDIEKLMAEDTFISNCEAERLLALDFIQRCYTDNGRGSGHMIPGQVAGFPYLELVNFDNTVLNYSQCLAAALISANRDEMGREFERYYDTAQKWAYKTPWQLREENVDYNMDIESWPLLKKIRYWPVTIFAPAFRRISEIGYRNKAGFEALITITALLRYHQDNHQYPQNLAELVDNNYMKKLPMDPYSDKSLRYKRTDEGFTLYSNGLNCTDDGGQIFYNKRGIPRQQGTEEAGDWVFWPLPEP